MNKEAIDIQLTSRQVDLVLLIDRGLNNREIAAVMGLAPSTVGVYLSSLYQKLGVKNRTDAARLVLDTGLFESSRQRLELPFEKVCARLDLATSLLGELTAQCAHLETLSAEEAQKLIGQVVNCEAFLESSKNQSWASP